MALRPAPLKAVPALICDWIELTILGTGKPFRLAVLQRAWDTQRETEQSDIEGRSKQEQDTDAEGVSGVEEDRFVEAVADELSDRAVALQDAYPFELNEQGTRLSFKDGQNVGSSVYLFCLLLTHNKSDEVIDGTWVPTITHVTRNLFQACSTLAAAGEVEGNAIAFGYPRPGENAPFLTRLKEVYAMLGEGKVKAVPLPGASPSPKDEEIDIIAWQPSIDGAAGVRYMLGQVASGHNWEHKSIKGQPINNFHEMWFDDRPVSQPISSIFIPFEILPTKTGNRKDNMYWAVQMYGAVFDRRRLPAYALKGFAVSAKLGGNVLIERIDQMPDIDAWVSAQVQSLKEALSA